MNFHPNHYVPVLKVKRGEKSALKSLSPSAQKRITPLLEIVERKQDKAPTIEAHLDTAFKKLSESVLPFSRCFLDVREIASDGPSAAAAVFERASEEGIAFTPVTGMSREADLESALSHRTDHGLALRLTREELEIGGLAGHIESFMTEHGLAPEDVDLIVDLGSVDNLIAPGVMALTRAFLAEVPDHSLWHTLTLSACAFPMSMAGVGRRSHALIERTEWTAWRDGLHARQHEVQRLPTYSDCAIQHPAGVEGFNPRIMQVSASVRYALENDWLLIKGVGARVVPVSKQFPHLATQLVYGYLNSRFAGPSHCPGCASIKRAADGGKNLGSAEVWRRLGTIHHLTVVTESLASLPLP